MFCVQIISRIQAEQGAGTLTPGNAALQNSIAEMLDLYTKVRFDLCLLSSSAHQMCCIKLCGVLLSALSQYCSCILWGGVTGILCLQNCQYWYSSREQLLGPLVATYAQRLFKTFWPAVSDEAVPVEVCSKYSKCVSKHM